MATIDITVTSQFRFEPDAVYLLEGAGVKMKVFEQFEDKAVGKLKINCNLSFSSYLIHKSLENF